MGNLLHQYIRATREILNTPITIGYAFFCYFSYQFILLYFQEIGRSWPAVLGFIIISAVFVFGYVYVLVGGDFKKARAEALKAREKEDGPF